MHFSILAAAFTFGSALAAPFVPETPKTDAHSVALPNVTSTSISLSAPTATGVPGHAVPTSVPAAPGAGTPCILEAVTLVKGLKSEIHEELVVVKTLVGGPVEAIEAKIVSITSKVEQCKSKVETLLATVKPEELPEADRENILCLVTDLKEMVDEVEECIVSLAGVLTAKILSIILPKLAALKDCLGLLVAPILKLAFAICALVKEDVTGVIAKIFFLASGIQNCLAKFLAPIFALLSKVL